ncbi:hypothetical protein [Morganella morganii]|uniref:hypothetical protein n=1 Tax=Morganella morganii TaxID=582 RepID=UPI00311913C2
MNNDESYLQRELKLLRLETIFLAMVATLFPRLKKRCRVWFMREADFLLDYAENGLLNSEDRKQINSISVFAKRLSEFCGWWCQHVIDCSMIVELEWKHAGNS